MRRSQSIVLTVVLVLCVGAFGSCSSSKKSSSKTTSSSTTKSSSGGVTAPASGGPTVNVTLGDTSGTSGPETLTPTPVTATAGKVTFVVKNTGTIKHEFVVLKTTEAALKVDADNKVSEATSIGEAGDVEVGKTKSVTLNMPAGQYVLVCNIAKHYQLGMKAPFKTS